MKNETHEIAAQEAPMTIRPTTTPRPQRAPGRRGRVGHLALVPLAALATTGALGAAAAVTAGPAGAATKTTTVTATETDFHIALSKKSFPAGKYTFVAKNKGQTTHALMITGPGLSNAKINAISPGQSAKLTVTFKKGGAYDVYCPMPGHKMLGMNVNIKVGGATTTAKSSSSGGGGYGY